MNALDIAVKALERIATAGMSQYVSLNDMNADRGDIARKAIAAIKREQALEALVDQAQELDMGYGAAQASPVAQDERGQFDAWFDINHTTPFKHGRDGSAWVLWQAAFQVGRASVAVPAMTVEPVVPTVAAFVRQLETAEQGMQCPMCGHAHPHQHTPVEIIIYRNGVKYGTRKQELSRADDQGDAKNERHDAANSGVGGRAGAHQHYEHRAPESDDHGRDGRSDGQSNGIQSGGEVRSSIAGNSIQAAQPVGEAVAPWPDFAGKPIHEGDTIIHPDGESKAVVMYWPEFPDAGDAWRARYSDGVILRLTGQIGSKGRAIVQAKIPRPTAPPVAQDQDAAELRKHYDELLYAVARKFPNETRHETALRYIRRSEASSLSTGTCVINGKV